jgi:hypothetical protein
LNFVWGEEDNVRVRESFRLVSGSELYYVEYILSSCLWEWSVDCMYYSYWLLKFFTVKLVLIFMVVTVKLVSFHQR